MKTRAPVLFLIASLVISMLVLPVTPMLKAPAAAQDAPQFSQVDMDPATYRTYDDMLVDQAAAEFPNAPGGEIVFRPGMDPAQYAAAKAAAAQAATGQRPASAAPGGTLGPGAINCEGISEFEAVNEGGGAFFPPDADGAVGDFLFGQTTNVHVTFWDRFDTTCSPFGPYFDLPLNTFMGYLPPTFPNATQLFDARIVHDNTFHRWVVSAEGFAESGAGNPQLEFIAVSVDDDPFHGWLIYFFDTKAITGVGCFWDYQQLGMSDTALFLTANVFSCSVGQRWVTINKQWLYQGIGFPFCFAFGGAIELKSWAPPQVFDLANSVWFVRAAPSGSSLNIVQLFSPDAICPVFGFFGTLTVPGYSVPPNATQPGTSITLDTLDARFQNRSKQLGGELWNVHSINLSPAGNRWYRIVLTSPPSLAAACNFFSTGTSADFNPSIAVNGAKNIAIGFSSTDAPAGVNARVRLATHTGAGCTVNANYVIFGSSVALTGNGSPVARWGDYSSTSIDPANIVYGVNERINNRIDGSGGSWGTHFFNATIP